ARHESGKLICGKGHFESVDGAGVIDTADASTIAKVLAPARQSVGGVREIRLWMILQEGHEIDRGGRECLRRLRGKQQDLRSARRARLRRCASLLQHDMRVRST